MSTGDRGRLRAGAARQQALVEAAFRRLGAHGFEGLRLRDVAAEVGIDHSTLHHYFPGKEDLVAAVVEYAARQFWPTMPTEGQPAARLRDHLAALGRMVEERPILFAVLGELDLRAERDPAVRAIIERHEAGWRAALAAVLRLGTQEMALVEGVEVGATIELIIAAVKGAARNPESADRVLQQLARLLVRQVPDGG